ncbi:MAG: S8 family serine peptidase [Bacteriovoracaceae bacterium]|nr:S8 family serine peptidase [Bacteriovoracaceae bacterium]
MYKQIELVIIFISHIFIYGFLFQSCSDDIRKTNQDVSFYEGLSDLPRSQYIVPTKDPQMEMQWHLKNTTQTAYALYSGLINEDINHDPVRDKGYTGLGVTIAVSDNGTEETHPDLRARIITELSRNYSGSNWHGTSSDNNGSSGLMAHGTATAGLISAVDGNSIGVSGVAPRASLGTFRYVGTNGSFAKDLDQQNGPFDIFNYSYGRSTCDFVQLPTAQIEQYKYGVDELRNGLGAIYVKAAGNEYKSNLQDCSSGLQGYYYGNANLEEDQSTPYLIVVGAVGASGISSSYSTPGSSIWVSAYGGEFGVALPAIITTDTTSCSKGMSSIDEGYNDFDLGLFGNTNCNYTATMNGTSAAAPQVSGGVALILEANPNLSWRDVKYIIAKTARKVDPQRGVTGHPDNANLFNHNYQEGWTRNSANYFFHNWYGFGVIDLNAAILMAENYQDSDYLETLTNTNWSHDSGNLSLLIPDSDSAGVSSIINVNDELQVFTVQVMFTMTHPYAGDIGLELTSPSNTKSILLNINSNILESNINNGLLLSNAFFGESTKGDWTLKVIDGANTDQGVLTNWKINFFATPLGKLQAQSNIIINNNPSKATLGNVIQNSSPLKKGQKKNENSSNIILNKRSKKHNFFTRDLIKSKSRKYNLKIQSNTFEKKVSSSLNLKDGIINKKIDNSNDIIDIKFKNVSEKYILYSKNIREYSEKMSYRVCSDSEYVSIDNSKSIILITTNNITSEYILPTKEIYSLIACNDNSIKLYNERDIYKFDLQKKIFTIISKKENNKNIYILQDQLITESLDQLYNFTYHISNKVIKFPKGFSQLFTDQRESIYAKDEKNLILLTAATTAITDVILNKESHLFVNIRDNKVYSILQFGNSWQQQNNLKIKTIKDIVLDDKSVYAIIISKSNEYHEVKIPLINFHIVEQAYGK